MLQPERIIPAKLNDDELWRRNGEYVDAGSYDAAMRRIASLEAVINRALAALALIAVSVFTIGVVAVAGGYL